MDQFTENATPLGLYDPQFEHDACGIGAVVDIKGRKSHQTVDDSMRAAGTIMQRSIRQRRRFLKYNSHKVDPSFLTLCCSQIAQPKSGIS